MEMNKAQICLGISSFHTLRKNRAIVSLLPVDISEGNNKSSVKPAEYAISEGAAHILWGNLPKV